MLTKCIWCENEPIKIKKNFLCAKCYALYRAHGKPEKKKRTTKTVGYVPVPNDITYKRGKTIKGLIYKYGVKMLADFIALSNRPFYSLRDFADKYGFTRERARQIHFRLIGKPFQETASKKTAMILEERKSMGCVHDPRQKINYYKKRTNKFKAAEIEKLFFDLCEEKGLNPQAPCSPEFDLKVNGFSIDVKSCFTPFLPPGAITPQHRYQISKTQLEKCHFFACYHKVEKSFFIIPKISIPIKNKKIKNRNVIHISEKKTNHRGSSKNRYWEFKDAWHLLK